MSENAIDREQLVKRCMGNIELAERVLGRFIDRLDDDLDELESALRGDCREETRQVSHRIKGSCANVAADSMRELAGELESMAQGDAPIEDDVWLRRFQEESRRIRATVDA